MNALSSIRTAWPPAPSPEQPQTGWKMLTHSGAEPWTETLVGLHVPAWWTGLRLTAAEGWNTVYNVRLRFRSRDDEGVGLPSQPEECQWTQTSGDWHPLPWALPASMASHMDLELLVTPVDNIPAGLVTSVRIAFHELGQIQDYDSLFFCNDQGRPVHMWHGRERCWGTPTEGNHPEWRRIHAIVPSMRWLLQVPWDDRYLRLNSWNDQIALLPHENNDICG